MPTAAGKVATTSAPWSLTWAQGNPARHWEATAWAPDGEAEARRLLLTASCQAAMARFRQGHWGQASWVPSQEPVRSQLTMATWAAVAE